MREMDIFQYEARGEDLVVGKVADDEGWREVKETLIKNVGTSSIPVIKVEDADFGQTRTLYLKHHHDGRDLHLEYAEKTHGVSASPMGPRSRAGNHARFQALAALLQRTRFLRPRNEVSGSRESNCSAGVRVAEQLLYTSQYRSIRWPKY